MPLKTPQSRRTITAPVMVATRLKKWRTTQRADRLRSGANWKNDVGLAFTMEDGRPVCREYVRRQVLDPALKSAGLERRVFHTLGHSAATLLLGEGHENPFNVSRMLGHADIATTTDTYGHRTTEAAERAATRMDALLARK